MYDNDNEVENQDFIRGMCYARDLIWQQYKHHGKDKVTAFEVHDIVMLEHQRLQKLIDDQYPNAEGVSTSIVKPFPISLPKKFSIISDFTHFLEHDAEYSSGLYYVMPGFDEWPAKFSVLFKEKINVMLSMSSIAAGLNTGIIDQYAKRDYELEKEFYVFLDTVKNKQLTAAKRDAALSRNVNPIRIMSHSPQCPAIVSWGNKMRVTGAPFADVSIANMTVCRTLFKGIGTNMPALCDHLVSERYAESLKVDITNTAFLIQTHTEFPASLQFNEIFNDELQDQLATVFGD